MDETTPLDEFHAFLEGRLDPKAGDYLRARMAADPAFAAQFEAYRIVHEATAGAAPPPACGVSFERLDAARQTGRVRRIRPWMAAAAALLTLAFDSDVKAATAVAHLERVWGSCRSELA